MAIFSDLELMGIMNEADDKGSYKDTVKKNARDLKDKSIELGERAKNNTWIGKKMANKKYITYKIIKYIFYLKINLIINYNVFQIKLINTKFKMII